MYATEQDLEVNGVWQDLGPVRIKLARSGNRNTLYLKTFKNVMKRWGKKNYEGVSEKESQMIMAEIFSKSIIKEWEIKNEKGAWESGIMILEKGKEKKAEPTPENIAKCLVALPDLFTKLQEWAGEIKTFQKETEEDQLQD